MKWLSWIPEACGERETLKGSFIPCERPRRTHHSCSEAAKYKLMAAEKIKGNKTQAGVKIDKNRIVYLTN